MKLGPNTVIPGLSGRLTPPEQDPSSLIRVRPEAPPSVDAPEPGAQDDALFGIALPRRLAGDLVYLAEVPEFEALLERGGPISIQDLPPDLLLALEAGLEGPRRGLVQSPHPGLRHGVFDFAKLHRAEDHELDGLISYLDPHFVRKPVEDKRTILASIANFLLPGAQAVLERFHLPLPFSADSGAKPLTFSMEAEAGISSRPQTLLFYAPDKAGALPPEVMPDGLLDQLQVQGGHQQAWMRMTRDQKRSQLHWGMLDLPTRAKCLQHYKSVDDKVTLHRIDDPKLVPNHQPLPKSLCEVLLWEGKALTTAEIVTEEHSPTLDTLFADVDAVARIGEQQPGFHIHQVVELSTPEDVERLGPKVTGLAALEDLRIFTQAMRRGSNLLTHTHLEVWSADGIESVAKSFEGGKIDPDAIDIHKFHCVGMRQGIYGDDDKRLGVEIRAIPMGWNQKLSEVAQRTATILAEGHLEQIPSPPWGKWNAGAEGLADKYYEAMKKSPRFAHLSEGAELSFSEVLATGAGQYPDRDAWKFACPFWSFESLPGVTPDEAKTIRKARTEFGEYLMQLSQFGTQALEGDRELEPDAWKDQLELAISDFFTETKVDEIIARTLDRVAEGKQP